jgi:hypothetical protein
MKLLTIFTIFISLSVCAEPWDKLNNPYKINKKFISNFNELPLSGELQDHRLGWPGNHWANYLGGIAHRWSSSNPQNFTYSKLTLDELKKLEDYKINELSPAEKFDIYRGDFKYSTVKKVLGELSPDENKWHGICHGEAPASLNHPEPDLVRVISKEGVPLTFYSSDIVGLFSYYYARLAKSSAFLVGSRCNANLPIPLKSSIPCKDINAGSFHIIMANRLGSEHVGFISDVERFSEVWNHVAIKFSSRIVSTDDKRIRVESIVTYAGEIAPKFYPVIGTPDASYFNTSYEYYLDIDKNGKVVGGDWISDRRPDFIWVQNKASFTGSWSRLNEIYKSSSR